MNRRRRYPQLWNGCVGAWCPSVDRSRSTLLTDFSGYGNNGTLTNMDPATDWVASGNGMALDFDGSNDFVTLEPSLAAKRSTTTVCGWIRTTSPGTGFRGVLVKQWSYGIFLNSSILSSYDWGATVERSTSINIANGNWSHVCLIYRDGITSGSSIWLNGSLVLTTTFATNPANNARLVGGSGGWASANEVGSTQQNINAQLDDFLSYNRALTPSEIALLATRRGIAYETYRTPIVRGFSGGGGGITGSASITEDNDTVSSTGTLLIQGSASITEADDTNTAAAIILLQGVVTVTEADDTVSSTATLRISGTSGVVEANDTVSSTAILPIKGTCSITEADDIVVGTGVIGDTITGTATITEANDTLSSTATIRITGTSGQVEADDTVTITGTIRIQATSSQNEGPDTVSSTGQLRISGSLNITEENDTVISSGGDGSGINISKYYYYLLMR